MKLNRYQKTALITVFATLFLILVGGLVRAAGAGLGCPDWPQCFGMWIPPTNASDLPAGYDASLFNPFHTWLEYINRLVGVLIGFLITLTFVFSLKYWKEDRVITLSSLAAFVLVVFQGWLGGQVVKSGLSAGMITVHMVLAMIIINVLLYATFRAMNQKLSVTLSSSARKKLLWISGGVFFLTLVQLVLGTQVRESVDLAKNILELSRSEWIDSTGFIYVVHRSFSWVVVITTGVFLWWNYKLNTGTLLERTGWLIGFLMILQIGAGIGMERLGIPGILQLTHLVGVAVLICTEFFYILLVGFSQDEENPSV